MELQNFRFPIQKPEAEMRVQTFGNLEVFVLGEPILFTRSKSKELLALLVDRKGAGVTTAEIAATLWEDKAYTRSAKNQVQKVIMYLNEALKIAGIEDVVIKGWNNLAVDISKFHCDYYRFLLGDLDSINAFT